MEPGAYSNVPFSATLNWAAPVHVTPAIPYRDCVTPSRTWTGFPETFSNLGSKRIANSLACRANTRVLTFD